MSALKDAADAAVASLTALSAAADAVLAAFQSGSDADIQSAIDELASAKTSADAETAKLQAAVAPPAPPAGS